MISGPQTSRATFGPPRWRVLLSAHRGRPAHALPARVSPASSRPRALACARSSTGCFASTSLPNAIRTDNGVPFATTGIHGLSQLNVWWLRFGIQHQRTRPASPQENGAPERMHKTLKAEAIRPPRATLAPQQRALNRFRIEYNDERAHQFLQGAAPGSQYRTSSRLYTGTLPAMEYPGHFIVKRITNAGTVRFKKRLLFIANALKQHAIGLEEVDDGIWSIHFCGVLLGRVDERDYIIRG